MAFLSESRADSLDRVGLIQEKRKYQTDDEAENGEGHASVTRQRSSPLLYISLLLNCLLAAIISLAWLLGPASHSPKSATSTSAPTIPTTIYSPVQDVIEYETVVFHKAIGDIDRTDYMGPSAEVNAKWEELYNTIGLSEIDEASASRLPNATSPLHYDQSSFVIELDVFHQLHCLNMLRKRLYPARYPVGMGKTKDGSGEESTNEWLVHAEHCVESLRQSLMCSSDVATIFWEWSERDQKMKGNTATTHTCRNFGKIRQWAVDHALRQEADWLQYVEGAPLVKGETLREG